MGGKSSKKVPELTGDERDMESKDKRNIYFGTKWRKKYEFDGRLEVKKPELMIKQIHKTCVYNQGNSRSKVWIQPGCGCQRPGKE